MSPYSMNTAFENKIIELGFSYQCNTDGLYIIRLKNDPNRIIYAQLVLSEPVDEVIHGSRNNNKTQAIGFFKIGLPTEVKGNDFLILAFQNTSNHSFEFIIIPTKELKKRLIKGNRVSTDNREVEIGFWLMPDNRLYETTDISVEAEWFYISKRVNGRMVDHTDWDYSEYLNGWDRIKMV
jgi:hypothetical protein